MIGAGSDGAICESSGDAFQWTFKNETNLYSDIEAAHYGFIC